MYINPKQKYAPRTLELRRVTYQRRHAERRAVIEEEKCKPCADCNEWYPHWIMDFDHVRGEKHLDVAQCGANRSIRQLRDEIAKCEVVCANCHRNRTHFRGYRYHGPRTKKKRERYDARKPRV